MHLETFHKLTCLPAQSCPTLCNPMDCSLLFFPVCGDILARILEWAAISSSRGSFQLRNWNLRLLWLLHWQTDSVRLEPPGKPWTAQPYLNVISSSCQKFTLTESWIYSAVLFFSNNQIIVQVFNSFKMMKRIWWKTKMSQEMGKKHWEERSKWWERVKLKEDYDWNWFPHCFLLENGGQLLVITES